MKKCGLMTIVLSMLIAAFCLNCFANSPEAQVKALEQQASRIEAQIDQAKKAAQTATDQQVKQLRQSVEHFIRQRVQIDAQIARLEGQIEEVQKQAQDNLARQLTHYQKALGQVQSQLSGMAREKKASQVNPQPQSQTPAVKSVQVPKPAVPQPVPKK